MLTMADSLLRRALSKCSDLRANVATNITASAVPPQINPEPDDPAAAPPGVVLALLPPAPRADKRKGKTTASFSSAKRLRTNVSESDLSLANGSSTTSGEEKLLASSLDISSLPQ